MYTENFDIKVGAEVTDIVQIKANKAERAKAEKKEKADALAAAIAAVLTTGDGLAAKHDGYIETYVTKANKALYELLAEIMTFAETVIYSENKEKIIKEMRGVLSYMHNIKTQKNSTDLTIIVRYVTRTNRKNACIYGKVLQHAFDEKIASSELVAFIEKEGSIDKICNKVRTAAVAEKNAENFKLAHKKKRFYTKFWLEEIMAANKLGAFAFDKARENALNDATRYGNFAYMICKRVGDEYVVIDALGGVDEDFETMLLARYFDYKRTVNDFCAQTYEAEVKKRYKDIIKNLNDKREGNGLNRLNEEETIETFAY